MAWARLAGLGVAWLLAGAGLLPAPAARAVETPEPPWYQQLSVNGFVSTSWSYNFETPDSRRNAYRVFDFDDNSFKVDVAELVLQRPVAKPRDGGFRVDLEAGSSIPRVSAASGLFRDPVTGVAQDVDLQQAYVSYLAPLGSGLHVDAGKFVTHCGAEVIEGYDGWNDNATHSFLFGFAIPFTHTGVRASYSFSPRVAATAMIVNGWDDAVDDNRSKSVGAQLALTPDPRVALLVNGLIGAEQPGDERDLRRLLDVVATLKPSARVTVVANLDLGSEDHAAPTVPPGAATWSGIAGSARVTVSERFALIGRAEAFRDADGARTGVAQTLSEFTLTPEWRLTPHAVLRGDLRVDGSDHDVFAEGSRPVDHQTTVLVNLLAWF